MWTITLFGLPPKGRKMQNKRLSLWKKKLLRPSQTQQQPRQATLRRDARITQESTSAAFQCETARLHNVARAEQQRTAETAQHITRFDGISAAPAYRTFFCLQTMAATNADQLIEPRQRETSVDAASFHKLAQARALVWRHAFR
jgi:hypothetical protein